MDVVEWALTDSELENCWNVAVSLRSLNESRKLADLVSEVVTARVVLKNSQTGHEEVDDDEETGTLN